MTDPELTFRLAIEQPDEQALQALAKVLQEAGVEVLRVGLLGLDARGPRSAIERALDTEIQRLNHSWTFVRSEIETGSTTAPVARAYFPTPPSRFS